MADNDLDREIHNQYVHLCLYISEDPTHMDEVAKMITKDPRTGTDLAIARSKIEAVEKYQEEAKNRLNALKAMITGRDHNFFLDDLEVTIDKKVSLLREWKKFLNFLAGQETVEPPPMAANNDHQIRELHEELTRHTLDFLPRVEGAINMTDDGSKSDTMQAVFGPEIRALETHQEGDLKNEIPEPSSSIPSSPIALNSRPMTSDLIPVDLEKDEGQSSMIGGENTGVNLDMSLGVYPDSNSAVYLDMGLGVNPDSSSAVNLDMGLGVNTNSSNSAVNLDMGLGVNPDSSPAVNLDMGLGVNPDSSNSAVNLYMGLGLNPDSNPAVNLDMGLGLNPNSNPAVNLDMGLGLNPDSNPAVNLDMGLGFNPDSNEAESNPFMAIDD